MGMIFDIIIIGILVLSIFIGYKKGLVKVGFSLIAFVVSALATIILYSPITNFIINNTEIDEKIENVIIENGTKEKKQIEENNGIGAYIENYTKNIATDVQNATVESAARAIAVNFVGVGVMILLFIAIRLLLLLLGSVADIITKLPIVKQFNEAGGILYGTLKGLLLVYVILAVVFFVVSINANDTINVAIESSYITKFFYNNNIILNILF